MSDHKPLVVRLAAHWGNHSESREICMEAQQQLIRDGIRINELEARVRYLEHQLRLNDA